MTPTGQVPVALIRSLADRLRSAEPTGPDRLPVTEPAVLSQHKLVTPYLTFQTDGDDEWACQERRRQARRASVLAAEVVVVENRLRTGGITFAILRGPALARCYPPGWPREANDIDVVVPGAEHVARAVDHLSRDGYYVARPVVVRREGATADWVGVALNKHRPDLENPVYLDLTAGGPAISRVSSVPIGADAWRRLTNTHVGGTCVPVFDDTALAVVLAVELMEREFPLGRDLLDFMALAGCTPDWEQVRTQVRQHHLRPGLDALARLAGDCEQIAAAELLRWLAVGSRQPTRPARRAALAMADRVYRATMRRSPARLVTIVERLPTKGWFALGLPVYAYPPHPTKGPLAGSGGRAAASLPGFRSRVRPIAHAEEVDEIFPTTDKPFDGFELTEIELVRWRELLTGQLQSSVSPDATDAAHIGSRAGAVVDDGGVAGTLGARHQGELVAAGRLVLCRHPLTGANDRRLEGFCAAPEHPDKVGALVSALPGDLPMRISIPARGTSENLTELLTAAGFQPEVLTVRKETAAMIEPAQSVRHASAMDADFVHDCLAVAVRRGLFGREATVDVREWVAKSFPVGGSATTCLVAEQNAQLIGHCYARVTTDLYLPRRCGFVVDVFVVAEQHGRGHARLLTDAMSSALHANGVEVLESEVAVDGANTEALLGSLARSGWSVDRVVWLRDAQ